MKQVINAVKYTIEPGADLQGADLRNAELQGQNLKMLTSRTPILVIRRTCQADW